MHDASAIPTFEDVLAAAARLQGHAKGGEILCMQSIIEAAPSLRFGEERTATVKNVAEPLRFRSLKSE